MKNKDRRLFLKSAAAATGSFALGYGVPQIAGAFDYLQPGDWESFRAFEASDYEAENAMKNRGIAVRKHIGDLSKDELEKFKAAIGIMRARSDIDPFDPKGWTAQALQHALYCSSAVRSLQVHWSWFFLPWHRGYLRSVEQLCAAAIGDKDFALPYWDWTRSPQIDPAYLGSGNPLHDSTRLYTEGDSIPLDFIDVEAALSAPNFYQFGGYPYPKGRGELTEGVMEQSFHNNVHNWLGGNMSAFPTAAFDPIFSGHHNSIDRVWAAWAAIDGHENPTDQKWLDTVFTYPKWNGGFERVAIKDMLDTRDIGYEFADVKFRQPDIKAPTLQNKPASFALNAKGVDRKAIANEMRSGRRYGMIKFERMQIPMHPLCVRVFISDSDNQPHYISTFTLLPVQTAGIGSLNQHVGMQVALAPELAEMIDAGKALTVHLEPVQLRGRDIPKTPIRLANVSLSTTDNV